MRLRRAALAAACFAVLTPAAPAGAYGVGCLTAPTGSGWIRPSSAPPAMFVTGALGGYSSFPSCTSGLGGMTAAATCGSTATEHVVDGAYCGILLPPDKIADCMWDPMGSVGAVTKLVIGFDIDHDGDSDLEPMSLPMGNGYVLNPTPFTVRLIGYPMSNNHQLYPMDVFIVRCWL